MNHINLKMLMIYLVTLVRDKLLITFANIIQEVLGEKGELIRY